MMNVLRMGLPWLLAGLLLGLAGRLPAQSRSLGLRFDDAAYAAAPAMPQFGSGSKFGNAPLMVDLRPYAPIPGDQGDMGSCVGWASGYAAMSIEYARLLEQQDRQRLTREAFSPLYIYNQVKVGDCPDGAIIPVALSLLQREGDVKKTIFDPADCHTLPPASLRTQASRFRLEAYMSIFSYTAPPREKIDRTKLMLANQKPVIIGMALRQNFSDLGPGAMFWDPQAGNTTPIGGHAMCVVGYDEGKQAFLIMNSWGPAWGQEGCIWVKYQDYGQFCKYGFAIKVAEPRDVPDEPVALSGSFGFRYPDGEGKEQVQVGTQTVPFARAEVRFNGGVYRTVRQDWYTGQLFQLVAMNALENEYVYVFSVDAQGQANIHWPLREGLSFADFDGLNNVPLIPVAGAELVIPGLDQAMQLTHAGTDNLCVLFSARPLEDTEFNTVVRQVRDGSGTFPDRLARALGDRLVPATDIRYQAAEMSFEARSSRGYIVPIVLQLQAQ